MDYIEKEVDLFDEVMKALDQLYEDYAKFNHLYPKIIRKDVDALMKAYKEFFIEEKSLP